VLKYVAHVFEPGVEYPEKQVNELLKRFNEDTASLRRGLVDNGTLQREKGIYWKSGTGGSWGVNMIQRAPHCWSSSGRGQLAAR
jgi:hypothetical protein